MSMRLAKLDFGAAQALERLAAPGVALDQLAPPAAREAAMALLAMQAPKAVVAEVRDISAQVAHGAIPLRLYRPESSAVDEALPALIFFHGGGWTICNIELYDAFCRRIANAGCCAVVSVEYRLAPEHKFPTAVDDAFAATRWVAEHAREMGLDGKRLAVGGDSAGGNLAAVTALMARGNAQLPLALQVLLYPATDMHCDTASFRAYSEGYFLTAALMRYFVSHYLDRPDDRENWRASPLLAPSHDGVAPAYVLVCGFDPLHDEGVAYARKLQAAEVVVELHDFEQQIHAFPLMDAVVTQTDQAIESIGAALRRAFIHDTKK